MEERRKYIRIPDNSHISYKIVPVENKKGEYMTKDISQGGLRFTVHQFIPKDSLLKIKLTLNKTAATFEGLVKVMWIKEVPYTIDYEIGVQFMDIPQKAAEHLMDYIKIFLLKKNS